MSLNKPLILPDASTLEIIRRELGEDPKVLRSQIKLFKEWLRSQSYLPNDVDEHLIENFVSLSRCDLEKAKEKFVRFVQMRTKLKDYYEGKAITEEYFKISDIQRYIVPHPLITPYGYRFGVVQVPKDPNQLHFDYFFHYGITIIYYFLLEDTSCGYKGIYDLTHLTPQHFAKVNLKQLVQLAELLHIVSPFIFHEMHFLNVPPLPKELIDLFVKLFGETLRPLVHLHKDPSELKAFIPEDMLPEDFGGQGKSLRELGENNRQFFVRDKDWLRKYDNLELKGEVPAKSRGPYLYEDPDIEKVKNLLVI